MENLYAGHSDTHLKLIFFGCPNYNSCSDKRQHSSHIDDNDNDSNFIQANHKNYNFLDCDWFKKLLLSTNSLAKLLLDSLLSDR